MPTFDFSDEQATTLVKFFQALDEIEDEFIPDDLESPLAEQVATGRQIFNSLQCIQCHRFAPEMLSDPEADLSSLAPDLAMSKDRLRPKWIVEWLKDPINEKATPQQFLDYLGRLYNRPDLRDRFPNGF